MLRPLVSVCSDDWESSVVSSWSADHWSVTNDSTHSSDVDAASPVAWQRASRMQTDLTVTMRCQWQLAKHGWMMTCIHHQCDVAHWTLLTAPHHYVVGWNSCHHLQLLHLHTVHIFHLTFLLLWPYHFFLLFTVVVVVVVLSLISLDLEVTSTSVLVSWNLLVFPLRAGLQKAILPGICYGSSILPLSVHLLSPRLRWPKLPSQKSNVSWGRSQLST